MSARRCLWNLLEGVNQGENAAWILGRDFNSTLSNTECSSEANISSGVNALFSDFVFNQGLFDAGFMGSRFTWCRGSLHERLDRFLINETVAQRMHFSIFHLDHLVLDHRPILFHSVINDQRSASRPFCFLACWLEHPKFQDMLSTCWGSSRLLSDNISSFKAGVRTWNRDIFGHIARSKRRLMARIVGIDCKLEHRCSNYLSRLCGKLLA
ncbi:hypothetical protein V6N11_069774 [Hibiscus sabdariffa]|uniref:Reverse transcriptase n=1 Tax=Hibiscus sabdariffa TaxID=183260 RepID=A0ABR2Q3S3_9ROSI